MSSDLPSNLMTAGIRSSSASSETAAIPKICQFHHLKSVVYGNRATITMQVQIEILLLSLLQFRIVWAEFGIHDIHFDLIAHD